MSKPPPHPKKPPKHCRICGNPNNLSRNNLCQNCQFIIMQNVIGELREKEGPYYAKWLRGMERFIHSTR